MSKAMITEAEYLRDAFMDRNSGWVRAIMPQFSPEPRLNVGACGWMWRLADGSNLIMSDDMLIAAPNLGGVR